MRDELDPGRVAERLAVLQRTYVAETVDEARERLARERPQRQESFEQRALRCLGELRALCDLARHLHAVPPKQ
jgi:hypothetical protein